MTQCAKIIVGLMANFGKVFYQTFTNVIFIFPHVFTFLTFFLNFYLNVYYIYASIVIKAELMKTAVVTLIAGRGSYN